MNSLNGGRGMSAQEYTRVPIWGTFPRDPALVPVLGMAAVFAWMVISSITSDHPWGFASLCFFAALIIVPLVLIGLSGVWVSDERIMIRIVLIGKTLEKSDLTGFMVQKSFWTNGMRVLSLVTKSDAVIPIPGWWLRSEARDQEAIELLQRAIGADSPLPMLRGRV